MLKAWDDRRDLFVANNQEEMLDFAVEHWLNTAKRSIQQRGRFAVALSGGSTPKAIYERLGEEKIDGSKIFLFWSDERAVPPDHPDSNYRMAMESGLKKLNIPPSQIFRMCAEKEIEKNSFDYEEKIKHYLGKSLFDLVMLGVGEDGHTASLFPESPALLEEKKLVVATFAPRLSQMRMTLTFACINQSFHSAIYATGEKKQKIVHEVLNAPILSPFPASRIGTETKKALWIIDIPNVTQNLAERRD
jgi:6-phosphogluconolactonase